MQITLEDGTEQEVFTAEELAQQKQAAIEEFKASNPDKSDELNKLQGDLKKANEELAKFSNKDYNFGELRKQKEAAEKKVEDVTKELDAKLNAIKDSTKKEVFESVLQDHFKDALASLAGNDEELKKKIEFHYTKTLAAVVPTTKEEITKKLTDAWTLSAKPAETATSAVFSSAGSGKLNIKGNSPLSPEAKELAQKLAEAGGMKLDIK